MTYQNNPNLPGYCPDPSLLIQDLLPALATDIRKAICDESAAVQADLNAKIATLAGSADLADLATRLAAIRDAIDLDGDGVLADLSALVARVAATEAGTAANAQGLASLGASIDAYKTSVEARFTQVDGKIAAVEERITDNDTEIVGIKAQIDALDGVNEAAVKEYICDNNARIANGMAAGQAAFTNELLKGCPIEAPAAPALIAGLD